jgi:hypothetical protein
MRNLQPSVRHELEILLDGLERHPVFANPYFARLRGERWTRDAYAIHRANFFYRTELTVKAIAHVCARAAAEDDQDTLILFAYILDEECGKGKKHACHARLMDQSHNLFGEVEFDLPSLPITEAKAHAAIIDETRAYRDRLHGLITGGYHHMLGVVMALECHADKMLRACRDAFRTARTQLDAVTFKKQVEIYFNCHLDSGVEERHAQDAKTCVANNVRCAEDLAMIRDGAEQALDAQLVMWEAMAREVAR